MAERNFEIELTRMFAEAPAMPDADLFVFEVDERLRRGWSMRRILIGGMGVLGGLVGGAQLLGGGVLDRLGGLSHEGSRLLTAKVVDVLEDNITTLPMGNEVLWLAATLAGAAIVFAITRVVREF